MPPVKCKGCGGDTNTAVSEVDVYKNVLEYADRCFAKMVDGKWVPGCAYGSANRYQKIFADSLFNKK